jgi:glucose/arabinose dehydrogenase
VRPVHFLFTLSLFIFSSSLWGQSAKASQVSTQPSFRVAPVIEGLHIPWGFDFLGEDQIIINEKNGQVSLYDLKLKKRTLLKPKIASTERGQGGLLDVRKHPQYPQQPWIYITFTDSTPKGLTTALARFQIQKDRITKFKKLLVTEATSSTGRHFGSRITFDSQGYLYFGVGDRGRRDKAQDRSNHAGTVIRLNDDGSVPKDNPYYGHKNFKPEIWSYGHRNPQGLVFDKHTETLWEMEHGPQGGDEINVVEKGKNYGWPVISYGEEYGTSIPVGVKRKKGLEQPRHYYVPSIAPCGLEIYSGKKFKQWKGNLFSGALALTHLNRVVIDKGRFVKEERLVANLNQRVRSVREAPNGDLYFSTDSGKIYKIF